jgi:hypothetical protein
MAVLELNQALDKAAQKNRLEELLAEFNIIGSNDFGTRHCGG